MAKNKKKGKKSKEKKKLEKTQVPVAPVGEEEIHSAFMEETPGEDGDSLEPKPKMKRKEFEKELENLQVELVKMQEWVKATGAKIVSIDCEYFLRKLIRNSL